MGEDAASHDDLADDEDCPGVETPEGALVREMLICNKKGLHARATAKFVQTVSRFTSEISVGRCGEMVGGTSIMGILTLGAGPGSTITVAAIGDDAEEALDALAALVADRFGEGE
jgi:phosphocarrier protein